MLQRDRRLASALASALAPLLLPLCPRLPHVYSTLPQRPRSSGLLPQVNYFPDGGVARLRVWGDVARDFAGELEGACLSPCLRVVRWGERTEGERERGRESARERKTAWCMCVRACVRSGRPDGALFAGRAVRGAHRHSALSLPRTFPAEPATAPADDCALWRAPRARCSTSRPMLAFSCSLHDFNSLNYSCASLPRRSPVLRTLSRDRGVVGTTGPCARDPPPLHMVFLPPRRVNLDFAG